MYIADFIIKSIIIICLPKIKEQGNHEVDKKENTLFNSPLRFNPGHRANRKELVVLKVIQIFTR